MRGIKIDVCIVDGEFDVLRSYLKSLNINLRSTGHDEHEGDIESHRFTIKERFRAVYNTIPFMHIRIRMVADLV